MPVKRVRVNTPDAPWMTQHLKSLILKRQKAFHKHGAESPQYKFYRNAVNRERKTSKANFYKTKVEHMKDENPKVWRKEVKRLGGASSRTGNVISQIQAEGIEDLNQIEVANVIKQAFFEPMEEYRLPQALPKLTIDDESSIPEVTETRIQSLLEKLNPSKACGPDKIPNWLLKEYVDLISFPVYKIINASFKEQRVPRIWEMADVSPLPKKKPVMDLKKRPKTYLTDSRFVKSCRGLSCY